MIPFPRHLYPVVVTLLAALSATAGLGQVHQYDATKTLPIQRAIDLVKSGRCSEALPALKRGLPHVIDKQLKYSAGMAMVRCAMALDQEQTVVDALLLLKRDSPGDPEVLYVATHYFSELGMKASQELQTRVPNSIQARKLEAESLESQGKNDEAAVIYNKILQDQPNTSGIHYRLGQINLAKVGVTGSVAEAKLEFQRETEVDPLNAAAQFVLGELARRNNEWEEAIQYLSKATKLDIGFSEAYLALGMSLAASGKFAEALSPLQSYVKMQPGDPAGHYQLGIAYSRTGDKAAATRELALQVEAAERSQRPTDSLEGHSIHP
jgi:tetratricopeptide (TPR) repeat protein